MTSIAGRYILLAPLGRGSMGTVYEAYDEHLDRRVALKRVDDAQLDDASRRRFRREARLTARISHPGVPAVYDLDDEYLAMEYVQGNTLRDLIAEAAPLPVSWVATIGLQIAAVLACAHRVSLIHRDLKPSNLLLTRDGAVKVIDFGVAALGVDATLSTLTPAGVIVGTATYQAPERMLGLYSPRSDLYSLGLVLRELAPVALPIIDELTAANPDDRPVSAVDVIDQLLPLLGTPPNLPAFTHRDADVATVTRAYLALINSSPPATPSPVPADLRQVRSQVDRLVAADQHSKASSLLSAAIDANPDGPLWLDLRRDLARVLFDSGNFEQAASALQALIPDLSARLGNDHAAVLQARTQQAQAVAHAASLTQALELHEALQLDLIRLYGPRSREVFSGRRSIAVLRALTGQPGGAVKQLTTLLRDQERALGPADPDVTVTRQLVGVAEALTRDDRPSA